MASQVQPAAPLRVLRQRSQFLAAAKGARVPAGSFLLQGLERGDGDPVIGVGFTCSKKVGNAVARNRAKRRLREVARMILPEVGRPGWDYVLVGRFERTAARDWDGLLADMRTAVAKVHT